MFAPFISLITSSMTDCCVRVPFNHLMLQVANITDRRPYIILQSVADFMLSWILIRLLGDHKAGETTSVISRVRSRTVSHDAQTGALS